MVKKLILPLFLLVFCANASMTSLDLAKNIVNDSSKNKRLSLLFSHKNYVDNKGYQNIARIIDILKSNSLIKFNYQNPKSLRLSFKTTADPTIFFKLINETLANLGYVYFLPSELIIDKKDISYKILINSQYILDPGIFYTYLKTSHIYIKNIRRLSAFDYEYDLDFKNATFMPNTTLPLDKEIKLGKPLNDYIFKLNGAKKLSIKASDNDSWFPKILFLDKNLNLVLSVNDKDNKKELELRIPKEVKYAIVSDSFDLDNIKRGLSIKLIK